MFAQILTLISISLIAAQAVNLFLIFNLPPPSPDFYRIAEVEQVYRGLPPPFAERRPLEVVTAASRGVGQSFEIVSEQQQGSSWRVKVRSKLNQFNASPADQLPKVVILPSKTHAATYVIGDEQLSSDEAGDLVSTVLGDAIGRSSRFAVIDR